MCGALNPQGLCFPMVNLSQLERWSLIVSRIKTGEKMVDVQYLGGLIALCSPVPLLWIQPASAAQESALTNSCLVS